MSNYVTSFNVQDSSTSSQMQLLLNFAPNILTMAFWRLSVYKSSRELGSFYKRITKPVWPVSVVNYSEDPQRPPLATAALLEISDAATAPVRRGKRGTYRMKIIKLFIPLCPKFTTYLCNPRAAVVTSGGLCELGRRNFVARAEDG